MISRDDVLAAVRQIYADGPLSARYRQRLRPYICPFEWVIDAVPRNARVLDVGCGAGLFLGVLAHMGRLSEGRGFDADGEAIAQANGMKRRIANCSRLTFERLAAEEPWPEGRFDVISMIDVVHHIEPDRQAGLFFRAASRLTAAGLLLYKDMAARPRWRAWANHAHDLVVARQWIHHLPLDEAQTMAAEAGLSAVRSRRENRLWYGHEFVVFNRNGR